jgi:hypothetical protein
VFIRRILSASAVSVTLLLAFGPQAHAQTTTITTVLPPSGPMSASPNPAIAGDTITVNIGTNCAAAMFPNGPSNEVIYTWIVVAPGGTTTNYPASPPSPLVLPGPQVLGTYSVSLSDGAVSPAPCSTTFVVADSGNGDLANPFVAAGALAVAGAGALVVQRRRRGLMS